MMTMLTWKEKMNWWFGNIIINRKDNNYYYELKDYLVREGIYNSSDDEIVQELYIEIENNVVKDDENSIIDRIDNISSVYQNIREESIRENIIEDMLKFLIEEIENSGY